MMRRSGFVLGGALLVYWLTMPPSLTWAHWGADGGDLAVAALSGRLPHPPGFPFYLMLASAWARVPWGDPAWRLTLLSAVAAAGTATLITLTARRRGASPGASIAAGLTLAYAPLFWSQAIIVEVYPTAAFLVSLLLWWRESERRTRRWAFSLGLIWGLAMAVHPTLIVLGPLVGFALARAPLPKGPTYGAAMAGTLLGLLPYALLPAWGPWPQPWGDLRSWSGWWDYVSAKLYRGYAFGLPLRYWPRRTLAWASLLARQFTPLGMLAALTGLVSRAEPGAWLTFGLGSLVAIGYDTPDSLVYLLPLLPLASLWLADGLQRVSEVLSLRISRSAEWLLLLLPLALLVGNWRALDLHHDTTAVTWLRHALAQAPPDAVLLVEDDKHTFALWYGQTAYHLRPDVTVCNRALSFAQPSYRAFLGLTASSWETWLAGRPLCQLQCEEVVCP